MRWSPVTLCMQMSLDGHAKVGFKLFGLSKKDLAIGGVTLAASLIPGGVVVAPLAGAVISTYFSYKDGKSLDDAIQQGVVVGLLGALPGGRAAGGVVKSMAEGKLVRLGVEQQAKNLMARGMTLSRSGMLKEGLPMRAVRGAGRGLGAAGVNAVYNKFSASDPPGISELPIKPIS